MSNNMGGGSSGADQRSSYATERATQVIVQSGDTVDLSGNPLVYTTSDSELSGDRRTAIDDWEKKRGKNKIEYSYMVDENGKMIAENKGGKTGVKSKVSDRLVSDTLTHIHPRGKGQEGILGGTFSYGDIVNFTNYADSSKYPTTKLRSYRAKASEGTYYIAKGKNFNPKGLERLAFDSKSKHEQTAKKQYADLNRRYKAREISYAEYKKGYNDTFNNFLINIHNDLLAGQKQYGYIYGLERSK